MLVLIGLSIIVGLRCTGVNPAGEVSGVLNFDCGDANVSADPWK